MARFDVYANPEPSERRHTPYLLDVQNDYIDHLETRVVVPLRSEASFGPRARDLHPLLSVKSDSVVLDVAALGAIPRSELKKHVASLKDSRESIQNALDALFGAF
jgi:toxin CcdB